MPCRGQTRASWCGCARSATSTHDRVDVDGLHPRRRGRRTGHLLICLLPGPGNLRVRNFAAFALGTPPFANSPTIDKPSATLCAVPGCLNVVLAARRGSRSSLGRDHGRPSTSPVVPPSRLDANDWNVSILRVYGHVHVLRSLRMSARPPVSTFRLTAPLPDCRASNGRKCDAPHVSIFSTCELCKRISSASMELQMIDNPFTHASHALAIALSTLLHHCPRLIAIGPDCI